MKVIHLRKGVRLAIAILFCLLPGIVNAQVLYAEGADMSNTAFGSTYNITSAGSYTVSGSLSTPGDGQDWHQVNIGTGLQLTGVTYSVSGAGGFNGGWGFAGCCGNTISGNGSGSFSGASYPLSAGTYYSQMFANFSTGNSYVITYTVVSTGGTPPSITSQPPNRTICAGSNTTFTVSASNATSYQWQVNTGSGFGNVSNGGVYSGATTATLTITSATAGMNGYLYRCVATGATSPAATSNSGTLTVNSAPAISAQPPNRSICDGSNTTFTVSASSTTGYQWQVNTGSGFGNVANGGTYSGATTATLTITGATTGMSGYLYRCIASGACTPAATSNSGTLTVNPTPSVTAQPPNRTICAGDNTTFTISANNTTGYQWQVNTGSGFGNISNGGVYSGATTATLTITGATAGMNGYQYRCIASGACTPAATSSSGTLTVNSAPAITVQPPNRTVCNGDNTTFGVTASSATGYQWQVNTGSGFSNVTNGGVYSGATTATLSITGASTAMSGYLYRCVVTGACTPSATSNSGTLSVTIAPAVTAQPPNRTICAGSNTTFTVSATNTTGYQWQVNTGSGFGNVTNGGVYSGATTATLTITGAPTAMSGYVYRCIATGTCSPSATSGSGTLTVNSLPAITIHPANSTICSGNNTSFSVSATGTALTYQWEVSTNSGSSWTNVSNTGIYTGATTATLNLTNATTAENNYQYRCVVSGTCTPAATTSAALLTINTAPAITGQPANNTICENANTSFNVTANGTALTYQWQISTNGGGAWANVTNTGIYSGATTATLNLTAATTAVNGYQYRCVVSGTCTPAATSNAATVTINTLPVVIANPVNSTICSGNNTSFNITATGTGISYQWQVSTNGGGTWANVANAGIYSGATTATLSLTGATIAAHGFQYRCVVSGTCTPAATSAAATLNINTAPAVTGNPANSTICENANTSFSVTATGTALTYQWQISTNGGGTWANVTNTGIYSGATTATLNLTAATTAVNGYQYRCVVSGTCTPAATSNAATVTINTLPVVTANPVNSTICSGNNTSFNITATGTGISYQWQVSTNGGGTWANVANAGIYSGATTATLSLTGATIAAHGFQYRCVVSGTCTPAATSAAATLNINTAPAVTGNPANSTICENANTSFSVTATGTALTYQWQISTNGGGTWSNVSNTGIYSGATTATLNLAAATTTVSGYRYRCVVSGTCPPSIASASATLTINTSPVITAQPQTDTICVNTNTSFTVAATGTALTYQWQVSTNGGTSWSNLANGGIYSNVTASTLNLANASAAVHNYQYRCVVSGTCSPAATSSAATLIINTTPVVTTQPTNKTVCLGDNTTYTVAGTSTLPVSYQWQGSLNGTTWTNLLNAGIYSGVTTTTLTLTNVFGGAYSMYRCVLSSGCITTPSNTATLTINTQPAIVVQPVSDTKCLGQNTTFSITATGTALSYQWQVSTNGGTSWANVTNGGIYTGAVTNSLSLTGVTPAYNGYRYRCVVSGTCPTTKTSSEAILTVNSPVVITANTPATQTLCSGDNTSLSVGATGTGISYKWYIRTGTTWTLINNGGIYSGATTGTLNITGITVAPTTQVFVYFCVISGTCNSLSTNYTYITVHAKPTITANPANLTKCDSTNNATFSVTATGTNLSYQWQLNTGSGWSNLANNSTYTGVTTPTLLLPNVYYSMNGYQYRCIVSGTCTPAVTSAVATLTVTQLLAPSVAITASSEDICTGTSVTFTPAPVNGGSATYVWKRNGNTVGSGATYTSSSLANGDIIWCDMTSNIACPSPKSVRSNQVTMKVTPYSTPTITITSDVGSSWCSGKPAVFRANITNGGQTPTYQWLINGQPVGANIDTYLTSQLINGDQVRCQLTSSLQCPSPALVNSNIIAMTINQTTRSSIVIAPNPDSVICDNTEVTMYAFYTNSGTNPAFQWVLNGQDIPGETGGTMKTTSLNNGDTVQCRFTSSATCVFPEMSNPVVFSVGNPVDPSVNVTVIYLGNNVYRFSAIPVNGGQNPSYQWYKNTVPIPGATGATYDVSNLAKTDKIHVEMTSSEPCVSINLETVESRTITTGVSDFSDVFAEIGLYPNPNNGQFTIKGMLNNTISDKEVFVKISNSLGQVVYSKAYNGSGNTINLPVMLENNLANGIYQVNISIDHQVSTIRFVLNR